MLMAWSSIRMVVVVVVGVVVVSPLTVVLSSPCKSTKFTTPNKSFSSCIDLPHLSGRLHYTFDPSDSTLSMAFTAPPPNPSGWVAWAINPNSTAMAGSQALLATKSHNGSLLVSTLDVQSYALILPGPISYKLEQISGESSSSTLTIFATWHLPPNTHSINQVWQVGPTVTNGVPAKHDFDQANLLSTSKLHLTSSTANNTPPSSPAEAPAAKITSAPTPASGNNAALGFTAFRG